MKKMTVAITRKLHPVAFQILQDAQLDYVVWHKELPPTASELLNFCTGHAGVLSMVTDHFNQHNIPALAQQGLKIIANNAVGVDNIDLDQAKKHKVLVTNTPDVLTESTAELTIALILALARNLVGSGQFIKDGKWQTWGPLDHMGMELSGKTLGILGMGRIGQSVARKMALAFNMQVIYLKQTALKQELDFPARPVDLATLLTESDVLSLHAALTKDTRALIGAKELGSMKKSALLINTARGALIVQAELVAALQAQQIAGAALDVTDPEPLPATSPLLALPNALVTPHIGSATREARSNMAKLAAQSLVSYLKEQKIPANIVR